MNEEVKEKSEEKPIEAAEEFAETIDPGLSEAELQRIRHEAIEKAKKAKHAWVAKGRGILLCTSCEFPHRAFIDQNKVLVGIEPDGTPILQ